VLASRGRDTSLLGDDIAVVVALVAMVVKDTSPVRPLDETMSSRIVDDLAPSIMWCARSLRGSEAAVDAVLSAGQ